MFLWNQAHNTIVFKKPYNEIFEVYTDLSYEEKLFWNRKENDIFQFLCGSKKKNPKVPIVAH